MLSCSKEQAQLFDDMQKEFLNELNRIADRENIQITAGVFISYETEEQHNRGETGGGLSVLVHAGEVFNVLSAKNLYSKSKNYLAKLIEYKY